MYLALLLGSYYDYLLLFSMWFCDIHTYKIAAVCFGYMWDFITFMLRTKHFEMGYCLHICKLILSSKMERVSARTLIWNTQTYLYRINNIQQCTAVTHKIYCKVLIRNMIQLAHLLPSSIHKHTKYKFVHREIRFYNAITMFAWYFICVGCERWKRTKEWANQPTSQLTNRKSEIRAEEMKKTINQFISSEKHSKSNALVFEDEENAGRCKILNTYMWCACACACARVYCKVLNCT